MSYSDTLDVLARAYRTAKRNNETYMAARQRVARYNVELNYMRGLYSGLSNISAIVVAKEQEWQDSVSRLLEARIMEYLSYVYPSDGYTVSLSVRTLRGKVHVDGEVRSYFTENIAGEVADTQGRLFQQIVSFAALVVVMSLLGVDTVYIDEAFSGAAKANIDKVNALLKHAEEEGLNMVVIAQDTNIARAIDANVLYLSRSVDNKTSIEQRAVHS